MKRVAKPVVFIVAILILAFTTVSILGVDTYFGDVKTTIFKGVDEIRWGIDIRGGVDVTFTAPDDVDPTEDQLNAAAEVMRQRLVSLNITDYEVYADTTSERIIVRFPWKEDEENFDAEAAIQELGETAVLTFRDGLNLNEEGLPQEETLENIILEGSDVKEAKAMYTPTENNGSAQWVVSLELFDSGRDAFAKATQEKVEEQGIISIWMDDTLISYPTVQAAITDGKAIITGMATQEDAVALANKINGGALPFKLVTENYSTIYPTLGEGAKEVMILSGIIAFALICIFMIFMYRLPGVIACIALIGQVGGTLAALTGFLPNTGSFTLTVPGIAGIILAIGVGVDANIITSERVKEELNSGKSLDASIDLGYKRAFAAIFDGNITVILVAIILLGTFGPSNSIFSMIMKPLLFMFPVATEGTIYSFGYTLMIGVILNFVFGILASRLMMKSISRFKAFRNPKLYGGGK